MQCSELNKMSQQHRLSATHAWKMKQAARIMHQHYFPKTLKIYKVGRTEERQMSECSIQVTNFL